MSNGTMTDRNFSILSAIRERPLSDNEIMEVLCRDGHGNFALVSIRLFMTRLEDEGFVVSEIVPGKVKRGELQMRMWRLAAPRGTNE